jgi:hypothetical protein
MPNSKTNSPNSPNQPPNQTPDIAKGSNVPARARANRVFNAKTISEIARFCSKGLTESEACRLLNLRPQSWFSWKSRCNRAGKFSDLLEEFRAGRIDSLIAKIEASADGEGMKQRDWRAAAFLLSVADAKRFSTSAMSVTVPVQVHTGLTDEQYKRIEEQLCKPKPVVEIAASEPKQIENALPETSTPAAKRELTP